MEMAAGSRLHAKTAPMGEADRAFLNFCRKGVNRMNSDEARALVEDTTGQYLVSPAIEQEIERTAEKLNVVRQLASVKTTTRDRVKVRSITEAQVGWGKLETGAAITETDPAPTERTIYVEDLAGLVKIGNDELEDNDYDLAAFLADSFGRAIAEAENKAFIAGTGHTYEQPDGITVDTTLLANTCTTAAANAVTIDDFLQMIYQVPVKYRPGSAFIVSSATELALRQLRAGGSTTGDGAYLWQPSTILGTPATFAGFPIYSQDDMAGLSGTAGVIGIFGNFQMGYRILDRREIRIQRLSELYSESGLTGFICTRRVGGYCIAPSNKALVLLKEHA
jgi:HK97 family phage major capsid protein